MYYLLEQVYTIISQGKINDRDGDFIPDEVEDAVEDAKEVAKEVKEEQNE